MGLVTAVTWTIAALAGAYLLSFWLPRGARLGDQGGERRGRAKVTRYPGALVFGHPALAVSALVCWAAGLVTGSRVLTWVAFGGLAAAALLGCAMFTRWLGAGRHGNAARGFPVFAVALHGLAGVATFTLVLLTASAL